MSDALTAALVIVLLLVLATAAYTCYQRSRSQRAVSAAAAAEAECVPSTPSVVSRHAAAELVPPPPSTVSKYFDPALTANDKSLEALLPSSTLARLDPLRRGLAAEIAAPRNQISTWTLMFSTDGGRSFPRLASALACARGPVAIVIEEDAAGAATGETPCVFGGVTLSSTWDGVRLREKNALATAAARARSARLAQQQQHQQQQQQEQASDASSRHGRSASKQQQQHAFFGDASNFVFSMKNGSLSCFRPRSSGSGGGDDAQSMFQYYFDLHSDREKVGCGMGGDPAASRGAIGAQAGMAWFVGSSLTTGESAGSPTYRLPGPLSLGRQFRIARLEVWSLDPDTIGEGRFGLYDDASSALRSREHSIVKALVQLNGKVLYSEREDICDRCE